MCHEILIKNLKRMCPVHAWCAVWVTDGDAFHTVALLILIIIEHDTFDYFYTWPRPTMFVAKRLVWRGLESASYRFLRKQHMKMWAVLKWLRIESSRGLLWWWWWWCWRRWRRWWWWWLWRWRWWWWYLKRWISYPHSRSSDKNYVNCIYSPWKLQIL